MADDLQLPALIMTPGDVARLRRELAALEAYLHAAALRAAGQPSARLPKTSRLLDELATANNTNLLDAPARERLGLFLEGLASRAPVVHISFAVDPSSAFLQKIVVWFRQNVQPQVLVRVGLQPDIAAGCVVRTTNKYFDLSLRERFLQQRHLLGDALRTPAPAPVVAARPVTVSEVAA